MKFKIEEFFGKLMLAFWLCLAILAIISRQDEIIYIIAGIVGIIMSILMMILTSFDFDNKPKSKLEKAEEKAIKYKYKLAKKELKKHKKEYKSLKKEIFKCIAKSESKISYYSFLSFSQTIPDILDKLNCDEDFRGLYFTLYSTTILWERKEDDND